MSSRAWMLGAPSENRILTLRSAKSFKDRRRLHLQSVVVAHAALRRRASVAVKLNQAPTSKSCRCVVTSSKRRREAGLFRITSNLGLKWSFADILRSHSAKHHAQIVCGHFSDSRDRESDGLRNRCDRFEVSQTPGRVAIAKASVERLVARGRCKSFAFVWAIEIERCRRRKYRSRTPDQSERRIPRRDVDHVNADDPVSRSDRPK